jgi:hypothetical protein
MIVAAVVVNGGEMFLFFQVIIDRPKVTNDITIDLKLYGQWAGEER